MQVIKYTNKSKMFGTSIDGYISIGGGGGDGSGLKSKSVVIIADANNLQDPALIGAYEIVSTLNNGVTKNSGFVFNAVTGRLSNYDVYAGEVITVIYKKI